MQILRLKRKPVRLERKVAFMLEYQFGENTYGAGFISELAVERHRADRNLSGVKYTKRNGNVGKWECIEISSSEGERSIGRPSGNYNTLTTGRLDKFDTGEVEDAADDIARELCMMLDKANISPERLLVCGLGNPKLPPDSIGPLTASKVRPTRHIRLIDEDTFWELECADISVITPDVTAKSGIRSLEYIRAITNITEPTAVIAVDSVMSGGYDRLGSCIQLSDTGVFHTRDDGRSEISKRTVGVPVIAIGVPTVINLSAICRDGFKGDGLSVSPLEISEICECASQIIGGAINQAFGL